MLTVESPSFHLETTLASKRSQKNQGVGAARHHAADTHCHGITRNARERALHHRRYPTKRTAAILPGESRP